MTATRRPLPPCPRCGCDVVWFTEALATLAPGETCRLECARCGAATVMGRLARVLRAWRKGEVKP